MRGLVFALCWFAIAFANAADGDVDRTFGANGYIVQAPADASPQGLSVAIQNDGRILVGGSRWNFTDSTKQQYQAAIWRFLPDGSPDQTFGSDGLATVSFASVPFVFALAVEADGSVLAAGNFGGFGVLRLSADGSPDTGFGNAGVVNVDFSDLGFQGSAAYGMAIDSQGRIVLAGSVSGYSNWGAAAVARLSSGGVLDLTLGTGGRTVVQLGDATTQPRAVFFDVAEDTSGRIWLSGNASATPSGYPGFLAVRLSAGGQLDSGFGTDGIVVASLTPGVDDRGAKAVLRDDKLTIGGVCDPPYSDSSHCLLRLKDDGTPDPAFGTSGWASVPLGSGSLPPNSMTCQSDGKCLVLSAAQNIDPTSTVRQFVVTRVDAVGNPDAAFGNSGIVRIDVPTTAGNFGHVIARAIALQGGQPILVGTTDGVPYVYGLFVTRLAGDLIFDSGFE